MSVEEGRVLKQTNRYIDKIKKFESIVIYGAGKYGDYMLNALDELGLKERVVCFVKSGDTIEKNTYLGVPVKSVYDVKEYYSNTLFILAVSSKNMPTLMITVKKLKIKHYMDAKPIIFDSYNKSVFTLARRKIRNKIYLKWESTNRTAKTKKSACHITYCIAENAGDTMLSQSVRKYLGFSRWNIKQVNQAVDKEMLDEINASDVLIIGGGGLFLPDTNPNQISGWQWAISEEQINRIQVPIVIFAVGYNFFKQQENTALFVNSINSIVRAAAFVGLRNYGSVNAIRNLVSDDLKEKIIYQPCTTTLIRKIYKREVKKNTKIIAINIAFDREDRRYGANKEEILNQIAKAVCEIERKGYHIVYVAHCDFDLKFLPYLDKKEVHYEVQNLTQYLPAEIIRFYQNIEVTIGCRGHAQMIPFGVGGKIISLGSHDKMRWFLEDINMTDCYIDLTKDIDIIASRIVETFIDITVTHASEMDRRLLEEQEKLWKISCENKNTILSLVERRSGNNVERI